MKKNVIAKIAFAYGVVIASLCANSLYPKKKALIWDLGYTLIKPRKFHIANYLGMKECIKLFLEYGRGVQSMLTERLFNILEEDRNGVNTQNVKDPSGRLLPQLMTDWLEGKISSNYALEQAFKVLDQQSEYWKPEEMVFLKKSFKLLFSPKLYATYMKPLPLMRAVLHKCARNPENTFYILSNWDAQSFDWVYHNRLLHDIFRYFKRENIFISGFEQMVKPDPEFFYLLLNKAKLRPEDCIFIDDQEENIKAARKIGMVAIHFQEKNIRSLLRQLHELGVC